MKLDLTTNFISEFNIDIDVSIAMLQWWRPSYVNCANTRLTDAGLKVMEEHKKAYKFDFMFFGTGAEILSLSKITTPYYVTPFVHIIVLFDEELVTSVMLYPNFERYLNILNGV